MFVAVRTICIMLRGLVVETGSNLVMFTMDSCGKILCTLKEFLFLHVLTLLGLP